MQNGMIIIHLKCIELVQHRPSGTVQRLEIQMLSPQRKLHVAKTKGLHIIYSPSTDDTEISNLKARLV